MKIAFYDYGFDVDYHGVILFLYGWKELLEAKGHVVEFVAYDESYNRLQSGSTEFRHPVLLAKDVDMESYDIVFFNGCGHGTSGGEAPHADEFIKSMSELQHPRVVFIDHDKCPIVYKFRNRKRKPQYCFASDAVLTYCKKIYDDNGLTGLFPVHEMNLFCNWRKMEVPDAVATNPDRHVDLLFMSRTLPYKGTEEMYKLCREMKKRDPSFTASVYGFVGGIGEAGVRLNPLNIQMLTKDPSKFKKNSPEAFIPFQRLVADQHVVFNNHGDAKFAWTSINPGSINGEDEFKTYPTTVQTMEGSTFTALRCGCVPIVNGNCRSIVLDGKTMEEHNCFLFLDDKNVSRLADDMEKADWPTMHQNVINLVNDWFNENRFADELDKIVNELANEPKRKDRTVVEDMTFGKYFKNQERK